MANYIITEDLFCLNCTLGPTIGTAGVQVDFAGTYTSSAVPTSIEAVISDASVEPVVIAGTDLTFSHTFAAAGSYTVTLNAVFPGTTLVSSCGPITIVIS